MTSSEMMSLSLVELRRRFGTFLVPDEELPPVRSATDLVCITDPGVPKAITDYATRLGIYTENRPVSIGSLIRRVMERLREKSCRGAERVKLTAALHALRNLTFPTDGKYVRDDRSVIEYMIVVKAKRFIFRIPADQLASL